MSEYVSVDDYIIEVRHMKGGVEKFQPHGEHVGVSMDRVAAGCARRYQENADITWTAAVAHRNDVTRWSVMDDGYDVVRAYVRPHDAGDNHPLRPEVVPIVSDVLAQVRFVKIDNKEKSK